VTFAEEADGVLAVQLFEPAECALVMDRMRLTEGWYDASLRVSAADGGTADVLSREARLASVLSLCDLPELQRRFDAQVDALVKPLIACYWNLELTDHDGSQIVRYGMGGHYETHDDVGETCTDRYFSVVCYLNDDFDGGGTEFIDLAYTVTPMAGKSIVFPARYLHRAQPVLAGEKYVAVSWVIRRLPEPPVYSARRPR